MVGFSDSVKKDGGDHVGCLFNLLLGHRMQGAEPGHVVGAHHPIEENSQRHRIITTGAVLLLLRPDRQADNLPDFLHNGSVMGQERLSFLLTDLMDLVHDQGDQLGIVSGIVNHGAGIDRQALTALTLALAQGGASDGVELADQLVKDSEEEILLGVKIVIDGTLAELGVACDLLQVVS